MKLSHRVTQISSSPIRKLAPLADSAEAKGTKVFYLNIGQPDLAMPLEAQASFSKMQFPFLKYGSSAGSNSYREALVRYYERFDAVISKEDLLITAGASEALYFTMMTLLDFEDEIITPEPFYANYNGFSEMAGVNIVPIPTVIENGFALPPVNAFAEKCSAKTKAILLCNPNNPTGSYYPKETIANLANFAKEHGLYLIIDEVYREFYYGEEAYCSGLNLNGFDENLIVIDSISKRYNACGARIGAILSRNQKVIAGILKYAQFRLCPPVIAQQVAEAALSAPDAYLSAAREAYRSRRDLLNKRLSTMEGVQSYIPDGAFYIFSRLPVDSSEKFCEWLIAEFTYENKTVLLSPGSGFYATPDLGMQEVRIAYVLNEKELEEAMDVLERALIEYPGRQLHSI